MWFWYSPAHTRTTSTPARGASGSEGVSTCWHPAGVADLRKVDAALVERTLDRQHGVYLTMTGVPTTDQRDVAALLYGGPRSVMTAAAALRRHGLRAPNTEAVDILVPAERSRENTCFVRIHRTARLPEAAYASGSVTFAAPARAVADFARGLTALPAVRAVAASAVQRRRCTVAQLADELARGPVQGSALLRLACRLTCAFAPCRERGITFRRLAHVVAGCGSAVLGSWRPSGAGLAGFRCTG